MSTRETHPRRRIAHPLPKKGMPVKTTRDRRPPVKFRGLTMPGSMPHLCPCGINVRRKEGLCPLCYRAVMGVLEDERGARKR